MRPPFLLTATLARIEAHFYETFCSAVVFTINSDSDLLLRDSPGERRNAGSTDQYQTPDAATDEYETGDCYAGHSGDEYKGPDENQQSHPHADQYTDAYLYTLTNAHNY